MKRIIATSDWHGLATRARTLVEMTDWNPETDDLIVLGDMIDRGPDSLGCVAYARELEKRGAIILRGNHEQMAVDAFNDCIQDTGKKMLEFHMANGGDKFWSQANHHSGLLPMIRWFNHLRTSFHRSDGYVFVHAEEMFKPSSGDYTVVFGHTPTKHLWPDGKDRIFHDEHDLRIGVDCGAVYGGPLGAISLPDGNEFYA